MKKIMPILLLVTCFCSFAYADSKTTALDANTDPQSTDILYFVDDPGGSAASQKITVGNLYGYIGTAAKLESVANLGAYASDFLAATSEANFKSITNLEAGTDFTLLAATHDTAAELNALYLENTQLDDTKGNGDTTYLWSANKIHDQLDTKLSATGVTYENLSANSDIGTGATQVSQGDHTHGGIYYTETEIDAWRNSTTQTEMGYVHGVTSDIQDQIDALGGGGDSNIYVNNANYNPNISDTALDVTGNVTESTWESIGPTDAGSPDNTWAVLDDVPSDADWIEVKVYYAGSESGGTPGDLRYIQVAVRENTGTEADSLANDVAHEFGYVNDDTKAIAGGINNSVKIPVDGNIIFDVWWECDFASNSVVSFYLTGYGYDDAGGGGGSGTDDQTAAEVVFTPAGDIAAVEVQAAIEEVDSEKQVDLDVISKADAEAGSAEDERIWTALRVAEAIAAQAPGGLDEVVYLADCSAIINGFCIDTDDDYLYYYDGDEVVQLYPSAAVDQETIEDYAGGMFTGNTETGIVATYQDADGTIDLVVNAVSFDATGTLIANSVDSSHYTDASIDHEHLAPDIISGLANVTSANADYIVIWDATDSALKKCDMGEVRSSGLWTDQGTYIEADNNTTVRVYDSGTYGALYAGYTSAPAAAINDYGAAWITHTQNGGTYASNGCRIDNNITGGTSAGFHVGLTSLISITHIGANGFYGFGGWDVCLGPTAGEGASSYSYGLVGREINVQNSQSDQGLKTTRTGNWSAGLMIVPENGLASRTGYNVSFGLALPYGGDVKTHVGIYLEQNAIVADGLGYYDAGGSSVALGPNSYMRFDGYGDYGINFANATIGGSYAALFLAPTQRVLWNSTNVSYISGDASDNLTLYTGSAGDVIIQAGGVIIGRFDAGDQKLHLKNAVAVDL